MDSDLASILRYNELPAVTQCLADGNASIIVTTEEKAKDLEQKLRTNAFTLEDFREQIERLNAMGPLDQILGMVPGFGNMMKKMKGFEADLRKGIGRCWDGGTDCVQRYHSNNDVGSCDISRFPICQPGETRCYNRKVWRDRFHDDIKQPMHYIDYDLVLCYPEGSRVCSSCSPGRYCESEGRCILDELNYDCEVWL